MIKKRSNPMLNSAGRETAKEKSNVLIPLALLTNRKILPTLNTLTTLINVGETKCCFTNVIKAKPETLQSYYWNNYYFYYSLIN